ncbi:MAG: Sec-independent protein translocase protein TatB [Gammaproteobacteria bacterium]|nr:Sec-independent protein translocase protein TatB [Gammaproteobacteria bacterium]
MFDVGFSELLIVAVVALLVLGPERLPKAARFAGLWVRRARAQWYSVKSELERELAAEEFKRQFTEPMAELKPQMQALEQDLREGFADLDPGLPTRVDLREDASQDADGWLPETEPVASRDEAADEASAASAASVAQVTADPVAGTDDASRIDEAPMQGDLLAPLARRDA